MKISALLMTGMAFLAVVIGAVSPAAAETEEYNLSASDHIEIKMGELEKQFATLTNEVERMKHEIAILTQKQERMNADIELRFKEMAAKAVKAEAAPVPAAASVPVSTSASEKPKAATSGLTTKQEYDAAYDLLKKNDFANAEKAFAAFVKKYPKEKLAGNAQYWLGETYYVRKNYDKAAVAFAEAYKNYPQNYKAPDNFLKLGLSMQELGKKDEACAVFKNYAKEYPEAPVAFRQRAEKEAGKIGCK